MRLQRHDKTFTRTRERFADVFKDVDGMIVSGFEHVLKPDPAIYHLLLDRYSLKAEECVFIDDRDVNIEAARAVGMKGIVYTGPLAAVVFTALDRKRRGRAGAAER